MTTFIDTSGLLAMLNASDQFHPRAAAAWRRLIEAEEDLVTTSYVLVETFALVQSRLGLEAVQLLDRDIVPLLEVAWVDEAIHRTGVSTLLTAARRRLSLVDCVSFETMRRRGLDRAFTFDHHFEEQGFAVVPDQMPSP
ncbi:MAG: PIN domain-containing protein [Acidobacteriota bacterium]|nr:PIN domain-containing protein [Acidobacteriota bacterium]